MPTMKDIAKATGVSAATVSYVLNNRPGTVSPETRERVMKAIRELNYRPSPLFRRKHASRSNTVGVLHIYRSIDPTRRHAYIFSVFDGILAALMAKQCNMTIFANEKWEDIPRSLRTYLDGRCDGLLIVNPPGESALIAALTERGFPFVVISAGDSNASIPHVDVDNVAAGRMATQHLIDLGHRRIAMLPGDSDLLHNGERAEGYRQALEAAGAGEYARVVEGVYSESSGYERAHLLLSEPASERPTALFCSNDTIALGAWSAANELGLNVPRDLSIVGFDDAALLDTGMALTSVRQPFAEISSSAVDMLLRHIEQDPDAPAKVILPTQLVVRDSTGPCAE